MEQRLPGKMMRVSDDPGAYDRLYRSTATGMGLDRPAFYFSLSNLASPDTLHRIIRQDQREVQLALLRQYGNWPAVQSYYRALRGRAYSQDTSSGTARELLLQRSEDRIIPLLERLSAQDPIRDHWAALNAQPTRWRFLVPTLQWHGSDNRYHQWLTGVLGGDFGESTTDKQPVATKIGQALKWTALLNGIAILLAYLIAVPTGLYMAWYADSRFDRLVTFLTFLLFSLPAFWLATMLNNFLTTPLYGMDWFATRGVGTPAPDAGWWSYLGLRFHHLFLPIFCLTYPGLAYLSRQMRSAARAELSKAYVKTARLKGLSVHRILWGHVLKNALFPLITLLANVLPSMLAGSVLIELIFYLPGMGKVLVDSVQAQDWPMVLAILLLNGLLTVLGILLADILYFIADPRLRSRLHHNPTT